MADSLNQPADDATPTRKRELCHRLVDGVPARGIDDVHQSLAEFVQYYNAQDDATPTEQPTPGAERPICSYCGERVGKAYAFSYGVTGVPQTVWCGYCEKKEQPTPGAGGAGDVDELERLARAATPGPWSNSTDEAPQYVYCRYGTFRSHSNDGGKTWEERTGWTDGFHVGNTADAAFIAAANPAAVLGLIAERDALRAAVEAALTPLAAAHNLASLSNEHCVRTAIETAIRQCTSALARGPAADGQG